MSHFFMKNAISLDRAARLCYTDGGFQSNHLFDVFDNLYDTCVEEGRICLQMTPPESPVILNHKRFAGAPRRSPTDELAVAGKA
jgi:hypothetical protein